jgi:hypothetical protein
MYNIGTTISADDVAVVGATRTYRKYLKMKLLFFISFRPVRARIPKLIAFQLQCTGFSVGRVNDTLQYIYI